MAEPPPRHRVQSRCSTIPTAATTASSSGGRRATPGQLTVWHTRFVDGAPDARGRVVLFSVDLPRTQNAKVDDILVGMVSGQDSGTFGSFYLDEISFRRGAARLPSPPPRR